MKVVGKRVNGDGSPPLTIELEAPELTAEQIAARKVAREARRAAKQEQPV